MKLDFWPWNSHFAALYGSARFWGGTSTVLATVTLALLVAALVSRDPPDFSERPVLAVVRDDTLNPLWAVRLARNSHQIAVDSLRPQPVPAGHVYELWLAPPGLAPPGLATLRPLGLLPQAGRKTIAETPANSRLLAGAGELLVTLEPKGGSPNPGPSGRVQFRAGFDGRG